MLSFTLSAVLALASLQSVAARSTLEPEKREASLPIVDLGYEIYRASSFNATGNSYNFSNIRYAAPPTGANRFAPPQAPAVNRSSIQSGLPDRICAQANPAWLLIAEQYIPLFLKGQTVFNQSSFNTTVPSGLPAQDPRTTEDCLFLDVVVPKNIFDRSDKHSPGAPVMVWIYGGGYTAGSKSDSGNPAGLILESEKDNESGIIYVSLNYRLGAFGWLSGPTFQANGTANAGLYDQRFALDWVQNNIAKFGGDPNRVTVFGESAGGGSIMHQITAFGGNRGPAPFQQAILQSPGFQPLVSNFQQEQTFNSYLKLLNVSTIDEARGLSFTELQTANIIQVGLSPYGSFTYGPAVDGNFVPQMPGELLLHHHFDTELHVMLGHNFDEGLLFTSPFIQNDTAFVDQILALLPTTAGLPSVVDFIANTLYPPVFDGSHGYTNQIARAALLTSEAIFTCNTFYLDQAYNNATFSYYFTVPPALHGDDIPYTYFNGPNPSAVIAPAIAVALQEYLTRFAETGSPNGPGEPRFVMYGADATVQELNITGITEVMDPAANSRCDWWQKVLYV